MVKPVMRAEDAPPLLSIDDAKDVDLIVVQRVNYFDGLGLWRRWGSTVGLRTVYENDDDVWNITRDNEMAYSTYEEGTEVREAVERYTKTASMITCTSPVLGDLHRSVAPLARVEILPNYVPAWTLDLPHDERTNDRMRLGWMGGGSHRKDLESMAPQVKRFLHRNPNWDLCIGGEDYRHLFKGVRPERMMYMPWVHITDEPKLFYRVLDFDIGICPLINTKFAQSKSPVKAIEYAARGIPAIASDVEPYRRFIRHGETGFLVKQDHEWLKYLTLLASDEELRKKMGEAAQDLVRREYTIEGNWQKWVNAYKSMFPYGWEFKDGTVR